MNDNSEVPTKYLEAMRKLRAVTTPVTFEVDPYSTFCMVTAMQLALKGTEENTDRTSWRSVVERLCKALGDLVTQHDPDLRELYEAGYRVHITTPKEWKP